jgi:ketosteroid isomerase-like protein
MRHLVLTAVLAATTLACRDAAAPRDAGDPGFSSESSDRAGLDLRAERASLIAAGNALSDAIVQQGVVAALDAAFTEDALFLSPRVNILNGRAAATSFLSSDALAPSALHWGIIVADVSNDGTQGFTWGQGSSTFDFGTGPLERASFFLTYWRRAAGDDWQVAAMVINTNGGGQTSAIPAGFGTPDTKHRRNFPNTEVSEQRAEILDVDAAFSAASVSQGSGPAFEQFAAPNAIALGEGELVFGPEAIGEAFASGPNDVISWVPRFSGAAASGDLGFSVGEATFVLPDFGTFYSKYLTIWQKQDTGEWRYVSDLGNSRPAPAS